MKAVKPNHFDQDKSLAYKKVKSMLPPAPLFMYSAEFTSKTECQKLLKRNMFIRKVDAVACSNPKLLNPIIKRNMKYLKGVKPPFLCSQMILSRLKQAKNLNEVKISNQFGSDQIDKFEMKRNLQILQILLREGRLVERLRIPLCVYNYFKRLYSNRLINIKGLSFDFVPYQFIYNDPDLPISVVNIKFQHNDIRILLPELVQFRSLRSLAFNVDFTDENENQDLLYEIFENLSNIKSLTTLRLKMQIKKIDMRVMKMKKVMKQFSNLESLYLQLDLSSNKNCGKLFSNLLPLDNLKRFELDIDGLVSLDCSDIAYFISSLKGLTTLKVSFKCLLYSEYDAIIKSAQKLKKITKFKLKEKRMYSRVFSFAFGAITKSIQIFKMLKIATVELGMFAQDYLEMLGLLKGLLNHPLLEKVKLYLTLNIYKAQDYQFNKEFYDLFSSLLEKLKTFKIRLRAFPENVSNDILKIFKNSGKDPRYISCQVETIKFK